MKQAAERRRRKRRGGGGGLQLEGRDAVGKGRKMPKQREEIPTVWVKLHVSLIVS